MKITAVFSDGSTVPDDGKARSVIGATDRFVVHVQSSSGVDKEALRRVINEKFKVSSVIHPRRQVTMR